MKRWLVVAVALALAAGTLWLLLAERPPSPGGPPMEHIDDASRQRLERVLRGEGRR